MKKQRFSKNMSIAEMILIEIVCIGISLGIIYTAFKLGEMVR